MSLSKTYYQLQASIGLSSLYMKMTFKCQLITQVTNYNRRSYKQNCCELLFFIMFVIIKNLLSIEYKSCNFILAKRLKCFTHWGSRMLCIIWIRVHQKITVFSVVTALKFFVKVMVNWWNILTQVHVSFYFVITLSFGYKSGSSVFLRTWCVPLIC